MSFQISPGTNVSEIDLTTVVPSVLTTAGAFAGTFVWGPANKIVLVDSEITLSKIFGKPDSNSAVSFFTSANFLSYGNNLSVVRAVGANCFNSTSLSNPQKSITVNLQTGSSNTYYSLGEIVYQSANTFANATGIGIVTDINASLNVISVSVSSGNFSNTSNTIGYSSGAYHPAVDMSDIRNTLQIPNSDIFQYSFLNQNNLNKYGSFVSRYPGALGNSLSVTVVDTGSNTRSDLFTSVPKTSEYVGRIGGANDEIHIAVVDAGGLFSGVKNTVLETFPFVSKASDAINLNTGSTNYYKQVIFNNSKYIYAVDPPDYINTSLSWGRPATNNVHYKIISSNTVTYSLSGGSDDVPSSNNIISGFDLFANKESTDISLLLTGNASSTVQQSVMSLAASRQDCVAFISPPIGSVVNNSGSESSSILSWSNALTPSSYVVADSNWKYQFDVYNNVYRWIPLNGDIAGLCVYTDNARDPWYSPAGFNRGQIKNAIKLAWNPSKTYRDSLYAAGVNPVVSFPGQGIVLFGDKTLQVKPSAFDRINVRRLFIVLEKAIAKAAQSSLFEFNDEFTRAQFVSLITPYLRDVMGRRGITDFKVVCDTTNNTPQVIDSNQFVGDIYIKPARSINFIQLNFVAVGTGVEFNTIVGAA